MQKNILISQRGTNARPEERYPPEWKPSIKESAKANRPDAVFMRADTVHEWRGFHIAADEYMSRIIVAPAGYKVPKDLSGVWMTVQLARKMIDKWLDAVGTDRCDSKGDVALSALEKDEAVLAAMQAEWDEEQLKRHGGAEA